MSAAKSSQVFDVVADGSRREILDLLAAGPRAVGEIATETGLSQPNASRHLRILREAGLVEPRVEAQRRIYELRPAGLAELIAWVAPYQRLWQGSLDLLEQHLDSGKPRRRRTDPMPDKYARLEEVDGRP